MAVDNKCSWCNESESLLHVLQDCGETLKLWKDIIPMKFHYQFVNADLKDWLTRNIMKSGNLLDSKTHFSVSLPRVLPPLLLLRLRWQDLKCPTEFVAVMSKIQFLSFFLFLHFLILIVFIFFFHCSSFPTFFGEMQRSPMTFRRRFRRARSDLAFGWVPHLISIVFFDFWAILRGESEIGFLNWIRWSLNFNLGYMEEVSSLKFKI